MHMEDNTVKQTTLCDQMSSVTRQMSLVKCLLSIAKDTRPQERRTHQSEWFLVSRRRPISFILRLVGHERSTKSQKKPQLRRTTRTTDISSGADLNEQSRIRFDRLLAKVEF